MLICMRTTLNLPDALVEAAKVRAREEGGTLTSFIEAALRSRLEQTSRPRVREMPTFGERGGPGLLVDILDRDALWAVLDEAGPESQT